MPKKSAPQRLSVGYHGGNILRMATETYASLHEGIIEAAQNAVDAGATRVFIAADVQERFVLIYDNGAGIRDDDLRVALMNIGESKKEPGKLGRFGLGLVSLIGKGDKYEIFSQPDDEQPVNHWTFRRDELFKQREIDGVLFDTVDRMLPTVPERFKSAFKKATDADRPWRTVARLIDVTTNRAINRIKLEDLERETLAKIGGGMRLNQTVMHVVLRDGRGKTTSRIISPENFSGEFLGIKEYSYGACGKIQVELYRTAMRHRGKLKGEITVQRIGDLATVRWADFVEQALTEGYLEEKSMHEAFNAIGSGYFEGRIQIENLELARERRKFVLNEALLDAYIALHEWYRDVGQAYIEAEQELNRDERYRELGQQSLDRLANVMRSSPEFIDLYESINAILPSAPSTRRLPPDANKPNKPASSGTSPRRRVAEAKAKPRTKESPHGAPRLQFAYEITYLDRLWEFELETGSLIFNVGHKTWILLDETEGRRLPKNDRWVMHYQEWLAMKVLMLLAQYPDPDDFEKARKHHIDNEVGPYAVWLTKVL